MRAGQPTEYLGVVLSGRVRIEVSDAWGETTILEMLGPGSLFAHGYACSMEPLDIDVLADTACEVVLLKAERIIQNGHDKADKIINDARARLDKEEQQINAKRAEADRQAELAAQTLDRARKALQSALNGLKA